MPRGNDSEAALHELADKFGAGVGNAENLIDANLAQHTQALRAAELLPRDDEATKEARKKLSSFKGPNGERAVDVAVRGAEGSPNRHTVCVFETEEGRLLLGAVDDKGKYTTGERDRGGDSDQQSADSKSSGSSTKQ